ncbi:MAG: Hpt domain-containing protein [Candidatus Omnitrophica bacterium]|nr:Hpt domain-containing protein [Candidatus Omnitrophota bacterium]
MENSNCFSIGNIDQFILQRSQLLRIPADTYKRILLASVDPSLKDLDQLRQAIDQKDYSDIQTIAHRLKGVYANLRIEELSSPAKEINQMALETGAIQGISKRFEHLKTSLTILQDAVQP